jgi:hypothetical protein
MLREHKTDDPSKAPVARKPALQSGKDPTADDLVDAHRYVLWEMTTLHAAVEARLDPSQWRGRKGMYSIFTDSLLLHVRSLYAFFTGHGSRRGDILAKHFVKNADGSPWSPNGLSFVNSCIDDICKFRSHLTYSRQTRERKWRASDVARMRDEIDATFQEFVSLLPKSDRSRWEV